MILAFTIYFNMGIYTASYNQGTSFSASGVVMNVRDTYLTQTSPSGDTLTNDIIVAVKLDLKNNGGLNTKLNTGLTTLVVDNQSYGQNVNYAKELYDLGTAYTGQQLSDEFKSYILAFIVPKEDAKKEMILKFNDNVSYVKGEMGAKNILVTLKPTDLTQKKEEHSTNLKDEEDFEGSVLEGATFKIDNYEINDKFKLNYKYCYGTNKCIDSSEYLTPTATGNYLKTLMKIDGEFTIDKNVNSSQVGSIDDFLNTFATINYKINDSWVTRKINTQLVKPKVAEDNDNYYIEVPSDIKNASEIYLRFNIRNQSYNYVLK
mgnify:CR=1 FL=1